MLSLLLALTVPQADPFTVSLARVGAAEPYGVASAQVTLPPFTSEEGKLVTRPSLLGRSVRIEVAEVGATPYGEAWIDVDGDGKRGEHEVLPLTWKEPTFTEIDLRPCGIESRLMFFVFAKTLKATLRTLYHFEGTFTAGDTEFLVRWIDMDASGTPSKRDRWIALPKAHLEKLGKPNGMFYARETDEPWHHGERELRVVECSAEGEVRLAFTKPKQSRHEFLAARQARIAKWWHEQFALEGDEFTIAHKIDKARKKAERPVVWYQTLELADARRYAKEVGKPLLIEFSSDGCGWCKRLEDLNFKDAEVDARLQRFACVRIDTDLDAARTNEAFGLKGVPDLVLVDAEGKLLHTISGWQPPADYVLELDKAIAAAVGRGLTPISHEK